jgi:5-deoxy-D-glucuronate isomerase
MASWPQISGPSFGNTVQVVQHVADSAWPAITYLLVVEQAVPGEHHSAYPVIKLHGQQPERKQQTQAAGTLGTAV